jgi:hypothetical protein
MANERLAADMATMLDGLQDQLRGIAELQQQRSLLTATATVGDKRIQVTVNAAWSPKPGSPRTSRT